MLFTASGHFPHGVILSMWKWFQAVSCQRTLFPNKNLFHKLKLSLSIASQPNSAFNFSQMESLLWGLGIPALAHHRWVMLASSGPWQFLSSKATLATIPNR